MPQRASRLPLVATLTLQATKALTVLRQEITQRERELAALKAQAARWQRVLREPARGVRPAVTLPRVPPPTRPRLDWSAILQELPTPVYHPRGGAKDWQTTWSCLRLCVALDER